MVLFALSLVLGLFTAAYIFLLTFFDALKILNLESRKTVWIYLALIPNFFLLIYLIFAEVPCPAVWALAVFMLFSYIFVKLITIPTGRQNVQSRRMYLLYEGFHQLLYALVCQILGMAVRVGIITLIADLTANDFKDSFFIVPEFDYVLSVLFSMLLAISGGVRIFDANSCKPIVKAVYVLITIAPLFVFRFCFGFGDPVKDGLYLWAINLAENGLIWLGLYIYAMLAYKKGKTEKYEPVQLDTDCKTQYPILMVHGVGFRDRKEFNYWGRIPRALEEHGASIFYGGQEGWSAVETNAPILKAKILEIMNKTGAKKVNVIAHSKGGLDTRWAISKLGMDEYIASLTTISTPHYGVELANFLVKMPRPLFALINRRVNKLFLRRGDKKPEFARVANEFTTSHAKLFNKQCPDSPKVYYQSYATALKNPLSDSLTFVPCTVVTLLTGKENDGLVTADSTHWGNFRGVIRNKKLRGISHADAIDITRADYPDFSIVDTFVDIVKDLKNMGY